MHVGESNAMLCRDAVRHLGHPSSIAIEYEAFSGDIHVRQAEPGDADVIALVPTDRFGYASIGAFDEPPIDPGCYGLHANRDATLTVDPHARET